MKRREFLKTSVAAVGAMGSLKISPMLAAAEDDSAKTGAPAMDNRPAEYLHRVQGDRFLPQPPPRNRIRFHRCRWRSGSGGRLCRSGDFAASRLAIWSARLSLPATAR